MSATFSMHGGPTTQTIPPKSPTPELCANSVLRSSGVNHEASAKLAAAICDALRRDGHLPAPPRESGWYWVATPGGTREPLLAIWQSDSCTWLPAGRGVAAPESSFVVLSPRLEPPR